MKIVLAECPQCKEIKDHETRGRDLDASGKASQSMTCKTCGTTTKVFFDPNTEDFQYNYDWPDDLDA